MSINASIASFTSWLEDIEERYDQIQTKPVTRVEACQFLANTKSLKEDIDSKELPSEEDLSDPESSEIVERYNKLISDLAENYAKAETLSICWNKLDADMAELTSALNNGGAGKLTVERLETSIAQLKETFAERTSILANLSQPISNSISSRS